VWDVTASYDGEFIAAAVDFGWRIPRGFFDLQKNYRLICTTFAGGNPLKYVDEAWE
jgi:hypothetical protein